MDAVEKIGKRALDQKSPLYDIPPGKESLLQDFRILQEDYAPGHFVFLIQKGTLHYGLSSPSGSPTVLAELGPGDVFGERLDERAMTAILEVRDALSVYPLNWKLASSFLESHRDRFEREKRFMVGFKRRRLHSNLSEFLFQGPTEKVSGWLSQVASDEDTQGAPLDAATVAEMTGESPARTLAVLAAMRRRGFIQFNRRRLEVESAEGLARMARQYAYVREGG